MGKKCGNGVRVCGALDALHPTRIRRKQHVKFTHAVARFTLPESILLLLVFVPLW